MTDFTPQVAAGKVLLHFTMSLDGFVAGPDHDMGWMTGFTGRPGIVDEYVTTTGAVLGGRAGWDQHPVPGAIYGGAWSGPLFILTHHPEDATPVDGVTFLDCDLREAVRIGLAAAAGGNLEVFSPTIGRQLLALGLVDEIDLHIAPVLLGDGTPLYDVPGAAPLLLDRLDAEEPRRTIDLRFRPASPQRPGTGSPDT
ncbi:MAG TPA: dihydrofolate reductase family protein [Thermomicrobiales bacterium]|jgi:dihydrofolate reductase|nr:dihydrofolate reductase family protein [Thermomicrobiales bacterium]